VGIKKITKKEKKKNSERKHQTTAPFHAPEEEKEPAKSGVGVCRLISVLSPPRM